MVEGSKYWTKPICEVLLMQEGEMLLFVCGFLCSGFVQVANGIGNYLRSEILHEAGVKDPFSKTGKIFADLTVENCRENQVSQVLWFCVLLICCLDSWFDKQNEHRFFVVDFSKKKFFVARFRCVSWKSKCMRTKIF